MLPISLHVPTQIFPTALPLLNSEYLKPVWFNFKVNYKGLLVTVPIKAVKFSMAKCLLFRLLRGKNYRSVSPQLYRELVISVHVNRVLDGSSTTSEFLKGNAGGCPRVVRPVFVPAYMKY